MTHLRIHVNGYSDSDVREKSQFAGEIRRELRVLAGADVTHPRVPPEPGMKGSAFDWAQLLITFTGTLPPLVVALQSWLRRRSGASIVLQVGDDRLALTDADIDAQRVVIDAWLAAHGLR
jgi:hypothetical protein